MKTLFLRSLEGLRHGRIEIGGRVFGDPASDLRARVDVHDERFYRRAILGGDNGMAESFIDGDWSSPDLTSVVRIAVRNMSAVDGASRWLGLASRVLRSVRHRLRSNTVRGSRKNIAAHYDLSNEFFRLWLDRQMVYSSAVYESAGDSLEQAQVHKLDLICRKLRLSPSDHVLEIGTGWGAFALHAARHYGCRVTTTTISREQHAEAAARFDGDPRITLLLDDYRKLRGQFDKIVSIEMFEAVGLDHYDEFFTACDRLLKPEGTMLMQTITMNEQGYAAYRKKSDFIQDLIFPGSELASVSEILRSVARSTKLTLYHAADIGTHYARTLAEWRRRFWASIEDVRALGFDERFVRMWDYYLAYCEGGFLERYIGDQQIVLTKVGNGRALVGEPWAVAEQRAQIVISR